MRTRRVNVSRFSIDRTNMTYSTSIKAIIAAVRSLFGHRRSLLLMLAVYAGLLTAIYLFVSTREATVSQLVLTLVTFIGAPALFFVLHAAIVVCVPVRVSDLCCLSVLALA